MKDMMTHRGYAGSVHYSDEDRIFFGKIEFIRNLISYEGTDVDSLRQAFEESVDDYLEACAREGREPERPFKGTFNVRTGSDLHRRAVTYAREKDINLNRLVSDALEAYLPKG
ncbi:MAG: type II toxin-antitoxin system HicB family antitoxin [Acidobacteriota bacterium]